MGLIKQIFVWLFIFIIGSLIVNFLIHPYSFNSFKSNAKSISEDIIDNVKSFENDVQQKSTQLEIDNYCEENIIPEELKVWRYYTIEEATRYSGNMGEQKITNSVEPDIRGNFENPKWKDGTDMVIQLNSVFKPSFKSNCRIGNKEGENINYIYCEGFRYFKTLQKTSENEEIQGYDENNYIITLIVEKDAYKKEPIYRTDYHDRNLEFGYYFYYKIIDYKCLKSSIK